MIAAMGSIPQPSLLLVLGGIYLGVGAVSGMVLWRRGNPAVTCAGAVLGWPLLSMAEVSTPVPARGPMAARIDENIGLLKPLGIGDDLSWLADSLIQADARLLVVDRLIADEPADADLEIQASFRQLRAARTHAAAEIEGVLSGLVRLRVQMGLMALAGDTTPIQARLGELKARVKALEEVSSFGRVMQGREDG